MKESELLKAVDRMAEKRAEKPFAPPQDDSLYDAWVEGFTKECMARNIDPSKVVDLIYGEADETTVHADTK